MTAVPGQPSDRRGGGARFLRASRLDLSYDVVEDRMRADVTVRGGIRRIWLTRRVIVPAAARLAAALDAGAPWRGRVAGPGVGEALRLERDVAVARGEEKGTISRRSAAPRDAAPAEAAFLATRIVVEPSVDEGGAWRVLLGIAGVRWAAPAAVEALAALRLDRIQAQQVLAVIEDKLARAGWYDERRAVGSVRVPLAH